MLYKFLGVPGIAYPLSVLFQVKLSAHVGFFWRYVRNPAEPFFGEDNFKRCLLFNMASDALGLNAANGPLGYRFKFGFCTWYNFITPGTLTCPLLPGVASLRARWHPPPKRAPLKVGGKILFAPSECQHFVVR